MTSSSATTGRRTTSCSARIWPPRAYTGIYADAIKANAGLSIADGTYVLAGGSNGAFVVRNPSRNAMPMLRTTFKTPAKAVDAARLYVTARGIYEVFLNGKRVGDDYYNPGLTQYNVTHMYQTYDVTSLLKAGDNAMGAMLGEGWWSGLLSFGSIWNHFGDRQSLLAKLVITYKDGTSETVTTNDRTWKYYGRGPIVYSSLDFGEVYDASREPAVAGWTTAVYDDSPWKPAVAVPLEGTTYTGPDGGGRGGAPATPFTFDRLSLIGQIGDSAGVFRTLTAKSVKEVRPRVFVYDMGQNLVGVPRITIANGRAGRHDHAPGRRDALSRPAGVGEERRHDHDGELPGGAEPGRLHDEGGRPDLPAALHVARLSVPRDHRHRSAAPAHRRPGRRHQLRPEPDGRLQDVQREGQPAVVEPGLVQRGQLPHDPDRLPAAQRAHGLVGRHQRVLAHRDLRLEREPVPHAAHVRHA